MRKFFVSFLLLGSFFIFVSWAGAVNQYDVVINEVAWMGNTASTTREWMEFFNNTNSNLSLSNWTLSWQHGAVASSTVTLTQSIAPFGYYLLERIDDGTVPGVAADQIYTGSLNNSGERMELRDGAGNLIDFIDYFSGWFAGDNSNKYTMSRIDSMSSGNTQANWKNSEQINGTPRALNFSTTPPPADTTSTPSTTPYSPPPTTSAWPQIKINEFVSDPESGNEWVELYNASSDNLDLAGGFICDSRNTTSTCKTISGAISANGWLKIDLLTDSYLNNTGDTVILKNPEGDIIDQIAYSEEGAASKGESWARNVDGTGDWEITTQITPGAANVIVAPVVPQSQSGSGGGSFVLESPKTSASSSAVKKTSQASAAKKQKEINLLWKIKYDPRLRQQAETFFDASKTIDPRGGRIMYGWNFDGQIIFGANVKYAFATSGKHEVIIHATSTAGTVDFKKITVMVYPANETAGSGVVIGDVFYNATGDNEEYIELKNITASTVDISNWKLAYKNDVYQIPTGTLVLAEDYLTFYKTVTGFSLNNSGGDLLLLNQDNILMDEMNYAKAEPAEKSTSTKKYSGRFFTHITDARAGQKGDWARIKGVVTVLPGVFGSQYFYLTDGTAGIQIYQSKKDFPPLAVGDLAQVSGKISEANGIKRINIKSKDDVDILSVGHAVTSTELNMDEIDESLAGGLARIEGEITEIKSNLMYVDNGSGEMIVYFKQGAKIDKHKFVEGENARVTGVLEQTKNGWQIWPRSNADIESLGPSADLLKKQAANNGGNATEKYLTATAGGVTTLLLAFFARARGAFLKRVALAAVGFIKKDKGQG